jgi:Phage integrase, N-terminal SAM-like domain
MEEAGVMQRESPERPSVAVATTGAPKLLDRVRQTIRAKHYSRRTESAYVDWIRRYVLFHRKRHPSEMGAQEIAGFLTWLATNRRVSLLQRRTSRSARFCSCIAMSSTSRSGRSRTCRALACRFAYLLS